MSLYKELGVSTSASRSEIRQAYKRLSLLVHPDRHNGDTDKVILFQRLQRAAEVLTDTDAKALYDAELRRTSIFRLLCMLIT